MAQAVGKSAPTAPEPRQGRKKSRPEVTAQSYFSWASTQERRSKISAAIGSFAPLGLGRYLLEPVTHSSRYGLRSVAPAGARLLFCFYFAMLENLEMFWVGHGLNLGNGG